MFLINVYRIHDRHLVEFADATLAGHGQRANGHGEDTALLNSWLRERCGLHNAEQGRRVSGSIELAKVAVNDTGSTAVVTDTDDGTRYEISNAGLEIVKNGEVLGSEPAIEFALPRFRRQVTGGALSWITNGPLMTCQN